MRSAVTCHSTIFYENSLPKIFLPQIDPSLYHTPMTRHLNSMTVRSIQRSLLAWFAANKRDLPWRKTSNPYQIFVVEVMLQQTQIKTVIPYHQRWLKAFPTIHSLANASLDRVLKLWEGLGYYSRARNLHKAAQQIVCDHHGTIPRRLDELQALPGIGRYTAGAIASIAYGEPVSLVDGNVMRVLSRLFLIKRDISKPDTVALFYNLCDQLVPNHRPGDFNQALMELGSLICVPEAPNCQSCPVRKHCKALQQGNPGLLPVKRRGARIKTLVLATGILKHRGRVYVRQRPPAGIWGGLWEFPTRTLRNGHKAGEAVCREFKDALGLKVSVHSTHTPVYHQLSHRNIRIYPFTLMSRSRKYSRSRQAGRWVNRSELKKLSFPVPYQKISNMLVPA